MALNFNATVPAAPSGHINVEWQVDVSGNASANVPSTISILPSIDATAQTADIATADLLTTAEDGIYRVSGYIIVTTVDGASSTLPKVTITWVDQDSGVTQTKDLTATNAGNLTTTLEENDMRVSTQAGSSIEYETSGYASGTPATMQYALHLTLEKIF